MWIEEVGKRYSAWKAGCTKAIAAEQALEDAWKELP